jgi:hypothetical protein
MFYPPIYSWLLHHFKETIFNSSPGYLSCRNAELHTLRRAAVEMAQIVASAA